MLEAASLVPRNHEYTGITNAQKLLIESYYASWRDPGAREKLLPRLEQHMQTYVDIIVRAQSNGSIDAAHNPRAIAMVLMTVPMGHTLMNLAGLERIDDADWMTLALGMSSAMKPKR
jgi:hypothetical protein